MIDDDWIRKIQEEKYPSGMQVFYNVDELEKAVLSGEVKEKQVGLVYHAIQSPAMAGMSSVHMIERKNAIKWRLNRLPVEVIVLVSLESFVERLTWK